MLNKTIDEAVEILKKGGTIIYPSDTVWALGCDATNKIAINKIFKIKKRDRRLPLICLMNSIEMLERYVHVGNEEKKFLKSNNFPTTIIYEKIKNFSTFKNSVAIRIPENLYCQNLIKKFNKPITSTSVNFSGQKSPNYFREIDTEILDRVNHISKIGLHKKMSRASRIIKISEDGTIKILRS